MNNNTRGTRSASDKQSYKNSAIGTRHSSISTPNNNIHININLNVKKKSQCIIHGGSGAEVGKKINNFVQVTGTNKNQVSGEEEKHLQETVKSTAVGKAKFLPTTNKKSQTDKKIEKTKKKVNKEKEKTASKPFTPEKQQKQSSEQKSKQKSKTGKKLAKQKASKSMENLKVFKEKHLEQDNRRAFDLTIYNKDINKVKSKSNSNSKQKSREKSATKLKKNRASSKNITATFQNSGIKKVLGSQRQTASKNDGQQQFRKSKKSLKVNKNTEKEMKTNEFMEEKKKNEQKKKKQSVEHSTKGNRIKDELMRGSKEKKEFFSKPEKKQGGFFSGKNLRHPIYFGDEEDDNYNEFEEGMTNAKKNGSNFSTHRTPQKTRVQSVRVSPQVIHITKKPSATKKHTTKSSLFQKYKHGKLTPSEYTKFITKIVMIQANWRGYNSRKKLLQEIWKMNRMVEERRRLIDEKREEFWDDDENNSITNLQVESEGVKVKKVRVEAKSDKIILGYKRNYRTPQESNYNSSFTPTDQIHTNNKKYESQSGNQLQSKKQQWPGNDNQNNNSNENSNDNSIDNNTFLMTQIQLLKRQLQEQNQKFTKLQKQNSQLKENLMSKVEGEKKKEHNDNDGRKGFRKSLQITTDEEEMAKKPFESQFIGNNVVNNNNIIKGLKSPSSIYVQSLKRQLASSSFESPSSRSFLKSPKSIQSMYNLQHAFKKKQLSIDMNYEKNSIIYKQMLQNNIVSPKTYNFKRLELDERYRRQKQEISSKFKQAEKVMKYISEQIVIVNEQKDGEDESPKKKGELVEMDNTEVRVRAQQQSLLDNTIEQLPQAIPQPQQTHEPPITTLMDNSSTSSNFRKYWTDDTDEVHKKVLEISHRIDQQLLRQSGQQVERQQNNEGGDKNFYSLDDDDNHDDMVSSRSEHEGEKEGNDDDVEKQDMYYQQQSPMFKANKQQQIKNQQQFSILNGGEYSFPQAQQQVLPNISNHSSTSNTSGRNLDAYNIHYPSSPSSNTSSIIGHNLPNQQKHFKFAVEQGGNELLEDDNQLQHQQQQQYSDNEDDDVEYIQTTSTNNNNQNDELTQNKSYASQSMKSSQHSIAKIQKGFDTRLTFIKQYCIALCEFIRSQDDLKQKFVQNISKPLKYDYFQYLKSYRTTMTNSQNDTKYNSTIQDYVYPYFKIIHGSVTAKGLNAQNTMRFDQLYSESYGVTKELTQQTLQTRKYFIHAIIDVFNQSLDYQRPGSIYGEPLPWLAQSKNLKNNQVKYLKQANSDIFKLNKRQTSNSHIPNSNSNSNPSLPCQLVEDRDQDQRLDKIFGIAIAKIIQWGSCLCGFIPQPVSFDGDEAQTVNIDEEQTNLVRETRLAYMLEKSLAEEEERMVDHTMEQLEVILEVQQIIYDQILRECVSEMLVVSSKRIRLLIN